MTLTWPEKARPALGRFTSVCAAGLICFGAAYLAVSQRFGVIPDTSQGGETVPVTVVAPDAPPPPPVIERDPPPRTAPVEAQQLSFPPLDADPPAPYEQPTSFAPPSPPAVLTKATFLERPNARDYERFFPARALDRGVSGRVVLDCLVDARGRLSCSVASEEPAGWGFGVASLRAAQAFRVAPATAEGRPTADGRIRVPMTWEAE